MALSSISTQPWPRMSVLSAEATRYGPADAAIPRGLDDDICNRIPSCRHVLNGTRCCGMYALSGAIAL